MRTICVTTLSVMLLTAFCGGAFGAEHCRPTGELQKKAQAADIAVDGCADVRVSQTECPISNGAMIEAI